MDKIEINGFPHVRLAFNRLSEDEMRVNAFSFFEKMNERRTVRAIDSRMVPEEILENIIRTAATAPSGAHKQPWTFCLISDPEIKKQIREGAEEEERISYAERMPEEWKQDLKRLATDWQKPFLEEAPYLIAVFKQSYGLENGIKSQHYYVNESVGIACGILITAIHLAGLVTVTHTPSPMNFLGKILGRPENERPYLLLPIGYPKKDAFVPDLERKPLHEVLKKY